MIAPEARRLEVPLTVLSPYNILFAPPFYPMWPHFHSQTELMFFYDDVGCTYVCDRTEYRVGECDLMVANPDQIHMCDFTSMTASVCCVIVDRALLGTAQTSGRAALKNHISGDERVKDKFLELRRICRERETAWELDAAGCVCGLLALLEREYSDSGAAVRAAPLGRLGDVTAYIEKNFSERLSVRLLASLAGLSEGRFAHSFSEAVGKSPAEYVNLVRISKACALLLDTELCIAEVAARCGFNSPAYFSEQFKKNTGIPPRRYRNIKKAAPGPES